MKVAGVASIYKFRLSFSQDVYRKKVVPEISESVEDEKKSVKNAVLEWRQN